MHDDMKPFGRRISMKTQISAEHAEHLMKNPLVSLLLPLYVRHAPVYCAAYSGFCSHWSGEQ